MLEDNDASMQQRLLWFGCKNSLASRRIRRGVYNQEGDAARDDVTRGESNRASQGRVSSDCPCRVRRPHTCTTHSTRQILGRFQLVVHRSEVPSISRALPLNHLSLLSPPSLIPSLCPFILRMFACPQCAQKCKSLSGLRRHDNSIHQGHPGLGMPVNELCQNHHPSLSGTYNNVLISLCLDSLQACAVIGTEILSHQTSHLKSQPSRQMTIGPPFCPELGLNLQISCLPMPSFLGERSTTSLSCGLPHLFLTATLRPSPTREISIDRLMRSRLAMSSGRAFPCSMKALPLKQPGLQNGRP